MTDINKKTYLFFIDLLFMFLHGPLQLLFFTFQGSSESFNNDSGNENSATENKPPCPIPGRKDGQFQYFLTGNPITILGGTGRHDFITSRRK